jgi:opacity protein-like surface antigen
VDRLTHCYDPQGEAVSWGFLVNAIRDFRAPDARLRPFLGAGLGATRTSVDFSGRFDGYTDAVFRDWYQSTQGRPIPDYFMNVAPGEKVLGSDASWGLSFQLIAGLSWRITEQATIDASYKYTRDALDIRTANLTNYYPSNWLGTTAPNPLMGTGLPQIGSFKGDLESQIFTLGLRWSFGRSK